jgi:hypothetical protein
VSQGKSSGVHGNDDTVGAAAAVGKLATGLSLSQAADVLEVVVPSMPPCVSAPTSWAVRWPRR